MASSSLFDLVNHPQLCGRVFHGLNTPCLLQCRQISTHTLEQVEGHIVEVVTESLFFSNRDAKKSVPYFSQSLLKPFARVCLRIPRPSKAYATRNAVVDLTPHLPEKDDDDSVDYDKIHPVTLNRFYLEIGRRLSPEVRKVGDGVVTAAQMHSTNSSSGTVAVSTSSDSELEELPPFPQVLEYLTQDQCPSLKCLKLQGLHFSGPSVVEHFYQDSSTRSLLQHQLKKVILCPQRHWGMSKDKQMAASFGKFHLTPEEMQDFLSVLAVNDGRTDRMVESDDANGRGGSVTELAVDAVKTVVAPQYLGAIVASGIAAQLERFTMRDEPMETLSLDLSGGNAKQPAHSIEGQLAQLLVQATKLTQLSLVWSSYTVPQPPSRGQKRISWSSGKEAESDVDPRGPEEVQDLFYVLAHSTKSLTHIELLGCWTLEGVQTVTHSLGPQLQVLDGTYLEGTTSGEMRMACDVASAHCPNLERTLPFDTPNKRRPFAGPERDADLVEFVLRLVTRCPKLTTLHWKVWDLQTDLIPVMAKAENLTDVRIYFDWLGKPLDPAQFALVLGATSHSTRLTSISIDTFNSVYGVGSADPDTAVQYVSVSDEFFATFLKENIQFPKLQVLRWNSLPGVSAEGFMSFVKNCCPNLVSGMIFAASSSTVSPHSTNPAITALRGKEKIVPNRASHPALKQISYLNGVFVPAGVIIDGVDLGQLAKELTD